MLATKQAMQVVVAHLFNGLGVALFLNVPPALAKLLPEDPACYSQTRCQQRGSLQQVPKPPEEGNLRAWLV